MTYLTLTTILALSPAPPPGPAFHAWAAAASATCNYTGPRQIKPIIALTLIRLYCVGSIYSAMAYNAVWTYAYALHSMLGASINPTAATPSQVLAHVANVSFFHGPTNVSFNPNGDARWRMGYFNLQALKSP